MRKLRSFDEIMLGPKAKQILGKMEQSQREFEQRQKAIWGRLVPEIAFVLLRCDAKQQGPASTTLLAKRSQYIPMAYGNISVLNARLFPAQFAFTGFAESPDAMRTNRTLLQMRPKSRGLATSDPRRGVFLTEKGREAAAKVMEAIGGPTFEGKEVERTSVAGDRPTAHGRERTRNPAKIIADCKGKLLYRRSTEGRFEETDIVHFLGLVSLYDHTPPQEVRKALRQLRTDAPSAADREFLEFLDRVEERFSACLNRAEPN